MHGYYITFRSVTYAQQAEQLLRRKGLYCRIQRTPRWMEEQGCGYCLELRSREFYRCLQVLQEGNAVYRKIYLRREDSTVEEVMA